MRNFFVAVGDLVKTKKATVRWPSAYCAISSGTSKSTIRESTQPTCPSGSRMSRQSSSTVAGFDAPFLRALTEWAWRLEQFLGGRRLQNGNFRRLIQLVKMFGFAAGIEMNVGVIASRARGFDRSALLLLRELLKSVIYRLRDQSALLDPAFGTAGCANRAKRRSRSNI